MQKSAEAFRTISEVAEELNVPKHVLRFWELKFTQVRPMKRGGGRRYYRPEDVELLNGIRALLHDDGFTIKGVQKILREHGTDYAKAYGRSEACGGLDVVAGVKSEETVKAKAAKVPKISKRKPPKQKVQELSVHDSIRKAISELEACRENLKKALT